MRILIVATVAVLLLFSQPLPSKADEIPPPELIQVLPGYYHAYEYLGRIYVISSDQARQYFLDYGELPEADIKYQAGPRGEAIVFEASRENPDLSQHLKKIFFETPYRLYTNGKSIWLYSYKGRTFVLGSAESNVAFLKHKQLSHTKTVVGGGAMDETLIYEINRSKPDQLEYLEMKYRMTPKRIDGNGKDYWVYRMNGRIFVVGTLMVRDYFEAVHELPFTQTLISAGPKGETVVLEEVKKDKTVAGRLKAAFF